MMLGVSAGAAATIMGAAVSVGVLIFKAGQWKSDIEDDHEAQEKAHQMVHQDVEKILDEMNGEFGSNRENCPTCPED